MKRNRRFAQARKACGWKTTHEAARHVPGVTKQQIANLEGGSGAHRATRQTDPGRISVKAMVALVEAYWPHLSLDDFVPRSMLRLEPRDGKAEWFLENLKEE